MAQAVKSFSLGKNDLKVAWLRDTAGFRRTVEKRVFNSVAF